MPAIEPRALRDLAACLRDAALAGNWEEVTRLDAALHEGVVELQAASPLGAATSEALQEVALVHAQVMDLVCAAQDVLAERMVALQTEHAAGLAYALQEEQE